MTRFIQSGFLLRSCSHARCFAFSACRKHSHAGKRTSQRKTAARSTTQALSSHRHFTQEILAGCMQLGCCHSCLLHAGGMYGEAAHTLTSITCSPGKMRNAWLCGWLALLMNCAACIWGAIPAAWLPCILVLLASTHLSAPCQSRSRQVQALNTTRMNHSGDY
jgi:hypothetical protein